MSERLTKEGRRVIVVYDRIDGFLGSKTPLPGFIRKSR